MALLNNTWNGRIRHAPLLNIAIFLVSIVTFGLAVSYAHDAIATPMQEQFIRQKRSRPTNSQIIAYSTAMPFFSILQSGLDLSLHFLISLHPVYSLVISILYFSGWLTQWTIWMNCEITAIGFDNAGEGDTCWQVNLEHRQYSEVPILSSEAIVDGRLGLGGVAIALYAAYAVMALMAVLRNRRRSVKGVKIESTEMR
ncbi:MAG: hypothetical protein Q9204_004481 [Flavoplaca sp. TL-2023a]